MFGPTGSTSTSSSPLGLQVNALSSDTLQYLGGKVGTIIEAKVIKVIGDTISTNNNKSTSNSPVKNTKASTESAQPSRYIIDISVNGQRLQVTAELAPRIGQILQLEVLSAQVTRLVSTGNIQSTSNISKPDALTTPGSSVERSISSTLTDKSLLLQTSNLKIKTPIAFIQQALRSSLPKQLGRADLSQSLLLLSHLKNTGQPLPTTANSNAAQQTASIKQPNVSSAITHSLFKGQGLDFQTTTNALINNSPKLQSLNLAFDQLRQSIPQQRSLETPAGVKQAIQNNGVFYEQKLGKLIENSQFRTANTSTVATKAAAQANNGHAIENIRQKLQGEVIQKDLKFRLLKVATEVKSLLNVNQSTKTEGAGNSPALERQAPLHALWQLDNTQILQQLVQSSSATTQTDLAESLLQILRLSLGAAARTQSQQLFALGSQFVSAAEANHTQTLAMELPMWLDHKLSLIDLRLEREPTDKKKKHHANTQWNIRLRFDLDEYGELTALASLRNRSMSAVFWASEDLLAKKINAELDAMNNALSSAGLIVQNLQCRTGTITPDSDSSIASLLESSLLSTKI